MNKTSIKLELYLQDIDTILHAFEVREFELGKSDDISKLIWVINMQMRKQGYEIKKSKLGNRIIVEKNNIENFLNFVDKIENRILKIFKRKSDYK